MVLKIILKSVNFADLEMQFNINETRFLGRRSGVSVIILGISRARLTLQDARSTTERRALYVCTFVTPLQD